MGRTDWKSTPRRSDLSPKICESYDKTPARFRSPSELLGPPRRTVDTNLWAASRCILSPRESSASTQTGISSPMPSVSHRAYARCLLNQFFGLQEDRFVHLCQFPIIAIFVQPCSDSEKFPLPELAGRPRRLSADMASTGMIEDDRNRNRCKRRRVALEPASLTYRFTGTLVSK